MSDEFIVVYHKHHCGSRGWEEEIIEAETREEAANQAAQKCYNTSMPEWSYHIVEAEKEIEVEPEPRKLTLKERLTGQIRGNNE